MTPSLTPRQSDVLSAIRAHRHRHGVSPRLDDIGEVLGINKTCVNEHVDQLVKKGVVRRDPHKARSLEVIEPKTPGADSGHRLPVPGTLTGGPMAPAEGSIDLATIFQSRAGVFALRVQGDALVGANIREGDVLILDRCPARSGERAVVVCPDGNAQLVRFNGGALSRVVAASRVLGVVIGVVRPRQKGAA